MWDMSRPNILSITSLNDIERLSSDDLLALARNLFINYHAIFDDIKYIVKLDSNNFSKIIGLLKQSKSQIFQDLFVCFFSDFKRHGYFIEFGAASGVKLSNTYLLEKEYDWSGILVEPFQYWHDQIAANRNCIIDHACITGKSGDCYSIIGTLDPAETYIREQKAGDTELNFPKVISLSLNDLIEKYNAPKIIDYISIDCEGGELEILETFDFKLRQVNMLTIEHNFIENKYVSIRELMLDNGYIEIFKGISRWDSWYIHPSLLGR